MNISHVYKRRHQIDFYKLLYKNVKNTFKTKKETSRNGNKMKIKPRLERTAFINSHSKLGVKTCLCPVDVELGQNNFGNFYLFGKKRIDWFAV